MIDNDKNGKIDSVELDLNKNGTIDPEEDAIGEILAEKAIVPEEGKRKSVTWLYAALAVLIIILLIILLVLAM